MLAAVSTRSSRIAPARILIRSGRDTERDYFMSSEEAKDYGIIDRVISQH